MTSRGPRSGVEGIASVTSQNFSQVVSLSSEYWSIDDGHELQFSGIGDMAKQEHSRKAAVRPAPYGKPKVQVTFEQNSSTTSSSTKANGKSSKAIADKPFAEVKKDKGKGKAAPEAISNVKSTNAIPSAALAQDSSTFIIVAGSYEKLLYGLEGSYDESGKPVLKPIFIFPAHLACVKAIAASPGGKWLATGSEDEFIKVWDLRRRKEVGSLSQHQGESCVASWCRQPSTVGLPLYDCLRVGEECRTCTPSRY